MSSISEVWSRLSGVQILRFTSESHSATGWSGVGSGMVTVSEPTPHVLVFTEWGYWRPASGRELRFSNVFRWTRVEESLHLEHLRFGAEKPVFLFEMVSGENGVWREVAPHPCRDDGYSATLHLEDERLFIQWAVSGPKRDELISYVYC